MKITEVRIFPTESRDGKLKAFATMTFDDWFVVRNVKIIQGTNGLFVAMPSRKAMDSCKKCGFKNARGSKYCNDCGTRLPQAREEQAEDTDRKQSVHMDIAHPVTQDCRVYIQERIIGAYQQELEKKTVEGDAYRPATMDDLDSADTAPKVSPAPRREEPVPSVDPAVTEDQDIAL